MARDSLVDEVPHFSSLRPLSSLSHIHIMVRAEKLVMWGSRWGSRIMEP